jgi:hypothetical protein
MEKTLPRGLVDPSANLNLVLKKIFLTLPGIKPSSLAYWQSLY